MNGQGLACQLFMIVLCYSVVYRKVLHMNIERLIWIDLEMTGLNPHVDSILEISTIVTDTSFNIIAEGPNLVIGQPKSVLDAMDHWNQTQHGSTGLTASALVSPTTMQEAESKTLEFLKPLLSAASSPMCGNSVCQDRRFLAVYMPELERFFHYRALDVTSIKIALQLWRLDCPLFDKGTESHRALDDVRASLMECKHYQDFLGALKLNTDDSD
jgi:oligoribonuclease